jgi:hypothetical protein
LVTYEHTPDFPAWKHPVNGLGSGHTLLTLKDDLELKFIADVVADMLLAQSVNALKEEADALMNVYREAPRTTERIEPPTRGVIYLVERNIEHVPLLEHIRKLIGAPPSSGDPAEMFQLPDGRKITVFNAGSPGWSSENENNIAQAAAESLVFVTHAQRIRGPRPNLALEAWRDDRDRKKKGGWPYYCLFEVGTYSRLFGSLGTFLAPKWWKMNKVAFAALKEARNARKTTR